MSLGTIVSGKEVGWTFMDCDAAAVAPLGEDVALYPTDGQGGVSATTTVGTGMRFGWATLYGIEILISPTEDTTVTIGDAGDIIILSTISPYAWVWPYALGRPAQAGAAMDAAETFVSPGVAVANFSITMSNQSPDDLSIRVWYREPMAY